MPRSWYGSDTVDPSVERRFMDCGEGWWSSGSWVETLYEHVVLWADACDITIWYTCFTYRNVTKSTQRYIVWGLLRYSGSVGIEQLGGSIAEFAMYNFHQPTLDSYRLTKKDDSPLGCHFDLEHHIYLDPFMTWAYPIALARYMHIGDLRKVEWIRQRVSCCILAFSHLVILVHGLSFDADRPSVLWYGFSHRTLAWSVWIAAWGRRSQFHPIWQKQAHQGPGRLHAGLRDGLRYYSGQIWT